MMEHQKLLAALKRLKVQTGSLACMGCGYEHDCGIHGCAIIREAVAQLTKGAEWISVDDRLPIEHDSIFKKFIDAENWRAGLFKTLSDDVIVAVKFADGTKKTGVTYTKDGVWAGLPSIGCPIVTHWLPMPEPPDEVQS